MLKGRDCRSRTAAEHLWTLTGQSCRVRSGLVRTSSTSSGEAPTPCTTNATAVSASSVSPSGGDDFRYFSSIQQSWLRQNLDRSDGWIRP